MLKKWPTNSRSTAAWLVLLSVVPAARVGAASPGDWHTAPAGSIERAGGAVVRASYSEPSAASVTPQRAAPPVSFTWDQIPRKSAAASPADDWAERYAAQKARQRRQQGTVRRAGYTTAASNVRVMVPSAFSGDTAAPKPPARVQSSAPEELLPPPAAPEQYMGGQPAGDFAFDDAGVGSGSDGDCCGGGCDDCCGDCGGCCGACCGHDWLENFTLFVGPQAFKGPPDQGQNGNFGLHGGLNFGSPFWWAERIGYQVGAQVVGSNFSGNNVFSRSSAGRTQLFITAGLFRRASYGSPWQWGVAYDYLSDDYYVNTKYSKIRGEFSFVASSGDEIGVWTSVGVSNDQALLFFNRQPVNTTFYSPDLYALFYRYHFANGGAGRIWGGFTGGGNSQAMVGGDLRVPLTPGLSFDAIANYLVPPNSSSQGGAMQESWALTMNLVWSPTRSIYSSITSPWRPLFNVADNTVFMTKTQ
jgi:hypothetical protein